LFGINWFGFTGLFGSACLSTQAEKERVKEKVATKQNVKIYIEHAPLFVIKFESISS
jgi:hypothetical protein